MWSGWRLGIRMLAISNLFLTCEYYFFIFPLTQRGCIYKNKNKTKKTKTNGMWFIDRPRVVLYTDNTQIQFWFLFIVFCSCVCHHRDVGTWLVHFKTLQLPGFSHSNIQFQYFIPVPLTLKCCQSHSWCQPSTLKTVITFRWRFW